MRFGQEIVRVDTCRKERSYLSYRRFRFDCSRQNDEVGFNGHLLVVDKIRALYHKFAVFIIYFADHTFDIVHAVLFYRATEEFVVVLARRTYVDIEYVHFRIGIFFTNKHSVFCRIHTANLRTVRFSATAGVTRTDALNKGDYLRMFTVGRTQKHTVRRTCCVH